MELSFRGVEPTDVPELEALLRANQPLFTSVECEIALDVIREGLERRETEDEDAYRFLVAIDAQRIVGYVCFGAIALTRGSYDLYWIAVHPEHQRRGIGRTLLHHCERLIASQGARLILAETSSINPKAQRFYRETMGYDLAARITDFYGVGEDRLTYVKYIAP
jgi:ribosomal protein S18 acetylase RimI-like enzyme